VSLEPSSDVPIAPTRRAQAHRRFSDMESEQKLWRWLVAAAMVVLLIEIWLGGQLTRPEPIDEGNPT